MITIVVLACGALTLVSAGFFAFADGALLSVDGVPATSSRAVSELVRDRDAVHRALAFGRMVSQLLAGALAATALKVSGVLAAQIAPGVIVIGVLVVIVAESAARAAGDGAGAFGLERVSVLVRSVSRIAAPVLAFSSWCDARLLRLLPPQGGDFETREAAVEQFQDVVSPDIDAERDASTAPKGVFALGDTQVQEIMAPRVDVVGIARDAPWSEVIDRVRSARHSRVLVFDGTLDEVVGVLHAKDLVPFVVAGQEPGAGWQALVRATTFVPSTKTVEAQLRDFKAARQHVAVVVDEYGGTAGLVTLEDVLEEIVGEIRDEHDSEEPEVVRDGDDRLWVSARISLDELSELTGEDFRRDGVRTVGGLVYELAGRVPRNGESLAFGPYRLVVERVVRRRVERVFVQRAAVAAATVKGAA